MQRRHWKSLGLNTIPKSERPPPITWGQVKATTYQAQQQLNQASLPQTPENLVAAVFSIITKIPPPLELSVLLWDLPVVMK
uniref:Uncharacterized protein n=1 Tax=Naja naja TaxID=35670 RepID=A0A8C6VJZ2_NAJNA